MAKSRIRLDKYVETVNDGYMRTLGDLGNFRRKYLVFVDGERVGFILKRFKNIESWSKSQVMYRTQLDCKYCRFNPTSNEWADKSFRRLEDCKSYIVEIFDTIEGN
jgi:hypothetical protein